MSGAAEPQPGGASGSPDDDTFLTSLYQPSTGAPVEQCGSDGASACQGRTTCADTSTMPDICKQSKVESDDQPSDLPHPADDHLADAVCLARGKLPAERVAAEPSRPTSQESPYILNSVSFDKTSRDQEARRLELGAYIDRLTTATDDAGHPSVMMPQDFSLLVHELFLDTKTHADGADWLAQAREQAAAAAEAATADRPSWMSVKAEDPKTQAALQEAIGLDKKLRETQIQAMIVQRELYPERWEDEKERRRAVMQKKTEEAIQAERKKRQHRARVERALTEVKDVQLGDKLGQYPRPGRHFMLTDYEEELVEKILTDESTGETTIESEPVDEHGFGFTQDTAQNMLQIESKLSQLAQDHLFDETGSMIDFRSKSAVEAASQSGISSHRPFSASTFHTVSDGGRRSSGAESVASEQLAAGIQGQESRLALPHAATPVPSDRAKSTNEKRACRQTERVVQDYLTQQRLAKEAARQERELDSKIRQLRTAEIPVPSMLATGEIESLIKYCKQAHEAYEARIDAINRMPTTAMIGNTYHTGDEAHRPHSEDSQISPADSMLPTNPDPHAAVRDGLSEYPAIAPQATKSSPNNSERCDSPSVDRPRSGSSCATRPTSSSTRLRTSSAAGPTRPARERQRQPRDASSVADVINTDAAAPRLILHSHAKEPRPRCPENPSNADRHPVSAAKGADSFSDEVKPKVELGDSANIRRVPSAGRRAGIPVSRAPL